MALAAEAGEDATSEWIAARDYAVLLLLYGSGLRVAEALGLTGAALPLGEALSVTGKRAKTRIVPLLAPVRAAIERYLSLCPYLPGRDEPLFRGARGGPLNGEMIRRVVRRARVRLGLSDRTTPHACGTASPRTCWAGAPTCARSRSCSATPASPRPRSTPRSTPPTSSTSTATPIRGPDRPRRPSAG
jgi:integrase